MLGVLWFFACVLLGYRWLSNISPITRFLSTGELIVSSVVLGTIGGAWLVYLTSCLLGGLTDTSILLATVAAYLATLLVTPPASAVSRHRAASVPVEGAISPSAIRDSSNGGSSSGLAFQRDVGARFTRDDALVAGILLAASWWLWPMYSHRMIPSDEQGNIVTGASCYGDLPIHMTIANSFLVGVNTHVNWGRMTSPIFAGEFMTYPFLPDFHAAVLVRLGETMRIGFLVPGFTLALALLALLYYFAVRVTRSRTGSILAIALSIFAGGMGGWRWAQAEGWDTAYLKDVVQHDPTGEWKMLWFAFIPHILLPQRGGNFAYPMVLLTLIFVWRAADATVRMPSHHRACILTHAAVFAATLPMVQAHAFIGVGIIIGTVFVLDAHKWLQDAKLMLSWALAGIVAITLAYPQMSKFTHTVSAGFYGKFMTYGWLYHNYEFGAPYGIFGFFRFWWYSLGPALHLFTAAVLFYCVEAFQAWQMGQRLRKDHGSGGVAHHLAALASEVGDTESSFYSVSQAFAEEEASVADGILLKILRGAMNGVGDRVLSPLAASLGIRRVSKAVGLDGLDATFSPLNALSVTGRALDTVKLAVGAFGVFLLGNYVNLQPWDRDNAKIFYIFVFVASALSGALLAAPLEYLLSWQPGTRRVSEWAAAAALCFRPAVAATHKQPPVKVASPRQATSRGNGSPGRGSSSGSGGFGSASVGKGGVRGLTSTSLEARVQRYGARVCAVGGILAAPILFYLCVLSGYILFMQEFQPNGIMLDRDAQDMGEFIKAHTAKDAVIMHSNYHVQPSGAIAGRPSLVAYYGWVSNHGYNSHERLKDRDYAMENALKDSDQEAYFLFRKWGVRFVVGEHITRHDRPSERAYHEAMARQQQRSSGGGEGESQQEEVVVAFDPDLYLDGQLRRIHKSGRYELFQVLGY